MFGRPAGIPFFNFLDERNLHQERRHVLSGKSYVGNLGGAPDQSVILFQALRCSLVITGAFETLGWPQQFADGIVERYQPAIDRRIIVKKTEAVVVEQRRACPDRDK